MSLSLKISKIPRPELSFTNNVYLNTADFKALGDKQPAYIAINEFVFTAADLPDVKKGHIAFNSMQRRALKASLGDMVQAKGIVLDSTKDIYLSSLSLEIDFLSAKSSTSQPFNCTELEDQVKRAFANHMLTIGQILIRDYQGTNVTLTVNSVEVIDMATLSKGDTQISGNAKAKQGVLVNMTDVFFQKPPGSKIKLTGEKSRQSSLFRPDWNFETMGIGGLDSEFSDLFRRAFASRVFPAQVVRQLGIQHVKGVLLFGPPGTGKTLMARQIGKMLNAREPKIVNGPEVLNKYVGQSEENVRLLFKEAEDEYRDRGDDSDLHIIIFDEIDAICKARGSAGSNLGSPDSVVTQLLSKIDGVNSLNNILVIGMTNRKDIIDEALLRPGRLEVHLEIGLPDAKGRSQILRIHTAKMRDNGFLGADVNLEELAARTKNFTGAEIESLVKSASAYAFNKQIDPANPSKPIGDAAKMKIMKADFELALAEVKPEFGTSGEKFENYVRNGIINYGPRFDKLLKTCDNFIAQVSNSKRTPVVSVLLSGKQGCGKTALAATLAKNSGFPFVKVITPELLLGAGEHGKADKINKIFMDASKSPFSVIVIDDIERILDYVPIGPRFSNTVLQTLLVVLKRVPPKNRRQLIIGTTSDEKILDSMQLSQAFDTHLDIPNIQPGDEAAKFLSSLSDGEDLSSLATCLQREMPIKKLLMVVEMAKQIGAHKDPAMFADCVDQFSSKRRK